MALRQLRPGRRLGLGARGEVPEVVLVVDDAAVLEAQPAGQLGVDRIGAGGLALLGQALELLGERVGALHVALVELEVLLDLVVGDSGEAANLREVLGLVELHAHVVRPPRHRVPLVSGVSRLVIHRVPGPLAHVVGQARWPGRGEGEPSAPRAPSPGRATAPGAAALGGSSPSPSWRLPGSSGSPCPTPPQFATRAPSTTALIEQRRAEAARAGKALPPGLPAGVARPHLAAPRCAPWSPPRTPPSSATPASTGTRSRTPPSRTGRPGARSAARRPSPSSSPRTSGWAPSGASCARRARRCSR